MFDFEYKPENGGFIPYVVAKALREEGSASEEEIQQLSEEISEQGETVASNSAAIAENANAIAENAEAIENEAEAREVAVAELNERINNIPKFQIEVVDELPAEGDPGMIYLVKNDDEETYSEYVYAGGKWEKLGTDVDLSGYVTEEEFENAVDGKANVDDVYSKAEADELFLTEHQDISYLATKTEVEEGLAQITDSVDTLSGGVENIVYDMNSVDEKIIGLAEANAVQDQEIVLKAEKSYVDGEIYKLTQVVGDIGGAVTYEFPNPAGKSFNALMGNNGTVKLTEDVTSGRFGPGITAKNTVALNLNSHNLTITGAGSSAGIQARGTEVVTIGGKGTIDADGAICIMANGASAVINLTGSTTVYRTDRSGGELIYCYAGTINITNGTFRNDGEDKTYMLNCYDANYKNGTAKIIVTGGKFYDFNPADNSAEGEHTSFVPEGYEVQVSTVVEEEVEHTVYTVKKSA